MEEPFDSFDEFEEPKKAIVSVDIDKLLQQYPVEMEQTEQKDKKEKTSIPKSKKNK